MINRNGHNHAAEPTYFDDGNKRELHDNFANSKAIHATYLENRPYHDETMQGVKTYSALRKNANSVDAYHIVSNLTKEQELEKVGYDGRKEYESKKTMNQEGLDLSERQNYKRGLQE
jgi:hypothetical protein